MRSPSDSPTPPASSPILPALSLPPSSGVLQPEVSFESEPWSPSYGGRILNFLEEDPAISPPNLENNNPAGGAQISPSTHSEQSLDDYKPTGSTRRLRTDNVPPVSENPGPVSPVRVGDLTDPTAYYNDARAAGIPAREAVYRPRNAEGGIDASIEPTPEQVIAFRQCAHEKRKYEVGGEDANVVEKWYEGQIRKLFENQMDALANQFKETLAHANTRDAFGITHEQLEAEFKENKELEAKVKELEKTIQDQEESKDKTIEFQDSRIDELEQELEEQKQMLATATDENSNLQTSLESSEAGFATMHKSWETQCVLVKGAEQTKEELNKELQKALSAADDTQKVAEEREQTIREQLENLVGQAERLAEASGGNDRTLQNLLEAERRTVEDRDALIKELRAEANEGNATELQNVLKEGRILVAERDTIIQNMRTTMREREITEGEQRERMNAENERLRSRLASLDAQMEEFREREGDEIIETQRNITQGPGKARQQREGIAEFLQRHADFKERIRTEVLPTFSSIDASIDIIFAKTSLAKKAYVEALGHLQKAETRNNGLEHPDRRIQGRLLYWIGRVELARDNAEAAVPALKEALKIERRPSSQRTLYAMTESEANAYVAGDEEERPEVPNKRKRGKDLDVEGWLKEAMRRARPEESGTGSEA